MPTTFSNSSSLLLTSESVTEGHPDKLCDQVSDAILDAHLAQDPMARVACETAAKTGMVLVFGEIMPKTYALQNPDRAALAVAPAFRVIVAVVAPVTHFLLIIIRGAFRLIGIRVASGQFRCGQRLVP